MGLQVLEIEFFAAMVAGSSDSGFRSRYSAHCEGEVRGGRCETALCRGSGCFELRLFAVGRAE
jgi:hypothetical protein